MNNPSHLVASLAIALAPISLCADAPLIYLEEEGLAVIEIESQPAPEGWEVRDDFPEARGKAYRWMGEPHLAEPGQGRMAFPVRVCRPGLYRLVIRDAMPEAFERSGSNSWVRVAWSETVQFFAVQGDDYFMPTSTVYPAGVGKEPLPAGSTYDGWFKVYSMRDWNWNAWTGDDDGHKLMVRVKEPATLQIEISARAPGHTLDRMVLFDVSRYGFDPWHTDGSDLSALPPTPVLAPVSRD